VLGLLAAAPVVGGLLGILTPDESEAAGRRKRRKKSHKHGKGRRRKHGNHKKKPQCTPTTCAAEGKYRMVLYATGTDGTGWEAMIEAWGWSNDEGRAPPKALLLRFNDSSIRSKGKTADEALDRVEAEPRALIQAHPDTRSNVHTPDDPDGE
jgi:hypothetical protein